MINPNLSATGHHWQVLETDANLPLMSQVLSISHITARVMANRGLRSKNAALSFLQTSLENLRPFSQLKDADKCLARITAAITSQEKITVFGDYDADGITSTVLLYKVLKRLGANCYYYIPHRIAEGYGLTEHSVRKIADTGTTLIIAVDSGISANAEIALATTLGLDTVVIDHHEQGHALPQATAIVNPKRYDCTYPFKEMCAGGLTYKLAAALCQHMKSPFIEQEEALVLAAIATICDIVPLQDENRIIASAGLTILNANKRINPGLGCLLQAREYLQKAIDSSSMGFVIGPCINVAGRLSTAEKAAQLLLSQGEEAATITQELLELNNQRRTLTESSVSRLMATLTHPLPKVLVLADTETHESIAGIVAGRIREATGRPTIVLTQGGGAMKGSGRSPECYNLFEALYANRHLFQRFGGHAMAAGLTMAEENITKLREALNTACTLEEKDFIPKLAIDGEIEIADISIALSSELQRLAPFGKDNEEPLFISRNVIIDSVRTIDDKNTIIFTFKGQSGQRVRGITFGMNQAWAQATADKPQNGFLADIVYKVETNVYNGNASAQVRVKDFALQ